MTKHQRLHTSSDTWCTSSPRRFRSGVKLTSRPYKRTVPCGRTERTKRDGLICWQIGPMSDRGARAGSKTRQDWTIFSDTRDECRGGKREVLGVLSIMSEFLAGNLWQRDSICPVYVLSPCVRGFLPDYRCVGQDDFGLACLESRTATGLYSKLACVKS